MPMRKLAIVTGASSGIGLEIAKLAAKDGYDRSSTPAPGSKTSVSK
jgi:NAD(P)-dependent dehydrogenase (short-subunit alcohol dehydrogenase family)